MSQDLSEIVRPFVENGLFENAENAIRNLMTEEEDALEWKIANEMLES